MWNGKNKAITFSYDDGVLQDIRLIEIFNKFDIKATFNLNFGLLGQTETLLREGVCVDHTKVSAENVRKIYAGHEIAAHTLTHPKLTEIKDDEKLIYEVEQDRLKLSELAGYEVVGLAYPCGSYDDRVVSLIKNNTGIKYARAVPVTESFEPCCDLYRYYGTLYHHKNWDKLFDMGRQFLELESDTPKVFYIWGHAYEFDIYPERWEMFEEFCRMMSRKNDIFYGTNNEVLIR